MKPIEISTPPAPAVEDADLNGIISELEAIAASLHTAAIYASERLDRIDPSHQASALNLVHYLALRQRDVRTLQIQLADLGLSSLGRSEGHILATIESVIKLLYALTGRLQEPLTRDPSIGVRAGTALLARNTETLLGPAPAGRQVRIMVTASTELATDVSMLVEMLEKGMNILRINCAHDDAQVWGQIIANLRTAELTTGKSCLILMDLAGPKLRTGPIEPGAEVMRIRPRRDQRGRVTAPARVWLAPAGYAAPVAVDATLPVSGDWLTRRSSGDQLDFLDARDSSRRFTLIERIGPGWVAESVKTAYVETGTLLHVSENEPTAIGSLPAIPGVITLAIGDTLVLTRSLEPGRNARVDEYGWTQPARIGCTLPDVFDLVKPGERVWFDDGKIGGIAVSVNADEIEIKITRGSARGIKLRAEKGINMPDSRLAINPLTEKDIADLRFITAHADMIGLSFVQSPQDIANLRARVHEAGDRRPGIVLKIETRRAFEQLPELIFEAMGDPAAGIMIARGDLAVEIGFERLAEVQEEILWIAEAAHLPVIWATQVLETLAQSGLPSRSEITDAAMGQRAECVMLNKGPHIAEAIELLDGILARMTDHQQKKRSLLRQLKSWHLSS